MREYLQLTRAHTAPLEMTPAIAGAILGTGAVLSLEVALWALFGLCYHLTGYGMNSYVDWKKGFDKDDENKQHHPLNSGELSEDDAKMMVVTLFGVTVLITIIGVSDVPIAAIPIIIGVVAGLAYNYYGKLTEFKFIPISIAHSSVFATAYLASGGTDIFILMTMTLFVLTWVIYQIAISGEVKDVYQDESNLAISMGTEKTQGGLKFPTNYKMFALVLKVVSVGIALGIVDYLQASNQTLYVIGGLGAVIVVFNTQLLEDGAVNRNYRLNVMAAIEMFMVYLTYVITSPVIGWSAVIGLSVLSSLWVMGFNKIMWGTNLRPDV